MGWAKRVKEKTMGKPFLTSRREIVGRLSRMVQYVAGGAAVTVSITWVDEAAERADAVCHVATSYGETSQGRPIGSLAGELPAQIATGHLTETQKIVQEQMESIVRAMAAAAVAAEAAKEGAEQPPAEEGDVDPIEAAGELAEPHEEGNADAHE